MSWCVLSHPADNGDAASWLHSDDGTELLYGAALYRSQVGSEHEVWELVAGGSAVAVGEDLNILADRLRSLADAVGLMSGLHHLLDEH